MLTSEIIKARARELGATVCGIGNIYKEENLGKDPYAILPNAKCIIGFGFAVPKGLYSAMASATQFYNYTSLGVKYFDEEFAEIFLLKMGGMIEDCGYDACDGGFLLAGTSKQRGHDRRHQGAEALCGAGGGCSGDAYMH